jgi:hypothetical protein
MSSRPSTHISGSILSVPGGMLCGIADETYVKLSGALSWPRTCGPASMLCLVGVVAAGAVLGSALVTAVPRQLL